MTEPVYIFVVQWDDMMMMMMMMMMMRFLLNYRFLLHYY